jgi:hypothetical protein
LGAHRPVGDTAGFRRRFAAAHHLEWWLTASTPPLDWWLPLAMPGSWPCSTTACDAATPPLVVALSRANRAILVVAREDGGIAGSRAYGDMGIDGGGAYFQKTTAMVAAALHSGGIHRRGHKALATTSGGPRNWSLPGRTFERFFYSRDASIHNNMNNPCGIHFLYG